ncbi:PH domain-containing protein [Nocardioides nitrophenolicus]|uniref:PH domain-containing protein n=1 Tax=Nocardioides nitrophenolicus TaxID=60489 RepID=UPI00195E5198|nr:PH domain-containing protein [Nocardioides nitrophenolicus]MBM7519239.1 putative membrane protein [Nocardioides nitrophenolicus]
MSLPVPPGPPAPVAWQRLDPRMLLVHPIKEVGRFLPVVIGLLVAGGAAGTGPWALLSVGVPVALGVVRYLTTTYRIADGRVELQRGLLQRHTLSTPLDRVRTVDLTASPVHRLLGLATLAIGTGSVASDNDERLVLDALPREEAARLRSRLLPTVVPAEVGVPADQVLPQEQVVARFAPRWLWYAPFSGTVLVGLGAILGTAAQLNESIHIRVSEEDLAAIDLTLVAGFALAAILLVVALAVGGYLVTNGGFALSRYGAAWHVRRGLLTRRETSIDVARLAGASIGEPAALRVARGRRVNAIVTGLTGDQAGSAMLLPPAPRTTGYAVAAAVLDTPAPVAAPLLPHGRAATTRRYSRALLGALPFTVAAVAGVLAGGPVWLAGVALLPLGVALALATDRARALGHAYVDGYVVMRSGSVQRSRDALAAGHVIGWNQRATWFQRRAGLVALAATTAGGKGQVRLPDVPTDAAIALAEAATPGLVGQFLEER